MRRSVARAITQPHFEAEFFGPWLSQAKVAANTSKGFRPLSFAVSMVVRTSASDWAAHMAR